MEIYGLGIVGVCMFVGSFIGRQLATLMGISGDVGGVAFAMILLVWFVSYREKKGKPIAEKTSNGIKFLSALYIPVVVAMSANQNVVSAVSGGLVPILSGVLAVACSLLLIPVISKIGTSNKE